MRKARRGGCDPDPPVPFCHSPPGVAPGRLYWWNLGPRPLPPSHGLGAGRPSHQVWPLCFHVGSRGNYHIEIGLLPPAPRRGPSAALTTWQADFSPATTKRLIFLAVRKMRQNPSKSLSFTNDTIRTSEVSGRAFPAPVTDAYQGGPALFCGAITQGDVTEACTRTSPLPSFPPIPTHPDTPWGGGGL